jgi:hypothetical protein
LPANDTLLSAGFGVVIWLKDSSLRMNLPTGQTNPARFCPALDCFVASLLAMTI